MSVRCHETGSSSADRYPDRGARRPLTWSIAALAVVAAVAGATIVNVAVDGASAGRALATSAPVILAASASTVEHLALPPESPKPPKPIPPPKPAKPAKPAPGTAPGGTGQVTAASVPPANAAPIPTVPVVSATAPSTFPTAPPAVATGPTGPPDATDPATASGTPAAAAPPAPDPAPPPPAVQSPAPPVAAPPPAAAVPSACSQSWGLVGSLVGALSLPAVPTGVNICGPGALRPAPAQVSCTKQVDTSALQAALDGANPGDRICAKGSSTNRLTVSRSGTPAAPIQVVGDGQTSVKGITIKADNVVVQGMNATGATAPGIQLTGNGVTLLNNTITAPRGGDGDGIRFFGSNLNILHNTVTDVRNLGGAHADCMQTFASSTPASQHVRIDSNFCEKIDNQCLIAEGPNSSAGDGSGKGQSSDIMFTNNYCDTGASQAVMVDDVQNMVITNNSIAGKNDKAFALDNKSTGAKIAGNKIAGTVGYEVGIDNSSKAGYQGPASGGQP